MLMHPAAAFPCLLLLSFDMNGTAAPLTGGLPAHRKPSLLLAEDEPSTREFLHEILMPHYEVTVALDGAQAIDVARHESPDLVLSNVVMPGVDGIGLVRWLRANARTATVPIILLSADNQMDTLRHGLEAGADDFLLKPFRPDEVLARLDNKLRSGRG